MEWDGILPKQRSDKEDLRNNKKEMVNRLKIAGSQLLLCDLWVNEENLAKVIKSNTSLQLFLPSMPTAPYFQGF